MKKFTALLLLTAVAAFMASCGNRTAPPKLTQGELSPGDTLAASLSETDLSPAAAAEITKNLQKVFNTKYCMPGDSYDVFITTRGDWAGFRYNTQGFDYYLLEKNGSGNITAQKLVLEAKKVRSTEQGTLQTTLWEAMKKKGVPDDVIFNFTDIFAWDIDFLTDPRVGDTFKVIREKLVAKNGKTLSGKILAARYTASGQIYDAVLFTDPDNNSDYYTPKGEAMRRAFLKAPLSFRRISSRFTLKRRHPILKYVRPHLGIDYAAPSGTQVSSIGEGTVLFAQRKGGFGNQVAIRHPNGYVSYYGHLKGFAKGVRAGVRVAQNKVIGYVGSTGLSTGPHLDFRITKNGSFVNFLALSIPHAQNVPDKYKEQFHAASTGLLSKLAEMR
jgi:murein DD-endopeptidase MepM/ murein hydrolase activator NlpD